MPELIINVSKKYWIAHNGSNIVHYGENDPVIYVSTGQPTLEDFDVEQTWLDRLTVLGVSSPNRI